MTAVSEIDRTPFIDAVAGLCVWQSSPFFVQVGGYDGVSFAPLRPLILERGLSGLIVEPIPFYFERIKSLYKNSDKITPVNYAIADVDGQRPIWRFKPEAVTMGILPPHFGGIFSFLMEDILSNPSVLAKFSPDQQTKDALKQLIEPIMVDSCTFENLFRKHNVTKVDILQVYIKGYELSILKMFDFKKFKPTIVQYEHQHLNAVDRQAAMVLLQNLGYHIVEQMHDTLAVLRPGVASVSPQAASALLDLGNRLLAEGRLADAFTLSDHLSCAVGQMIPGALLLRARCHHDQNRMLDAVTDLRRFRDLTGSLTGHENFATSVFNKSNLAILQLQTESRFDEAADIAENLVSLLPGWAPMVTVATRLMYALGRSQEAANYARQLLKLEPGSELANYLLFWEAQQAGDKVAQRYHLLRLAEITQSDNPPHLRLQLFLNLLSLLLAPMKAVPGDIQLARNIARRAEQLTDAEIQNNDAAKDWFRFFHLVIQAVVLEQELGDKPEGQASGPTRCVSSTGSGMSTFDIQTVARKTGAKTVFLVAADEKYFRLYARLFALSALVNSDVPSLIIIHVIGGDGRLVELAQSLGIDDERLILTADDFDPATVTTLCVDSPPNSIASVPLAHFQCARFAQTEYLLSNLELPIFISDIDCILLAGVDDILQSKYEHDVVFNFNAIGKTPGDTLTANLLLLNPTHAGKIYSSFLRDYLNRALKKKEVSRWIDQIGLLMIFNHLQLIETPLSVGYFAGESDINNGMYTSIPDKPCRFLSLFRTFDLASLEPKVREWENALSLSPHPWPPAP